MSLVSTLFGRLSRKYDRTPGPILGLRLSYQGGSMVWAVANDVLTTQVIGGIGENLTVDLTQYTVGSLAAFLAAQPGYLVLYLDQTGYAGLGAIALVEGSNDIALSNGDHIFVATNPTFATLSAYSTELMLARIAIEAAPSEMATTTADGEWLDLLGSYYAVPRQLGELDPVYGPRIPAEVILPRQNNLAIEIALQVATGQLANCTDAIVYGNPLPVFDGAIAFSGAPHFFNATAARIYNLFDVNIGYALTSNQTPAQYLTSVRGQIDRLRAAGTHLRLLTLGPSIMADAAPAPTDSIAEVLTQLTFFATAASVTSADFATANFDSWVAQAVSSDVGVATLITGSIQNTSALAGAGSMSAVARVRAVAQAALHGAGGATLASIQSGRADMTGAGALTANALAPQQYALPLGMVAAGAFTGAASHTPQGLAVMVGGSTLTVNTIVIGRQIGSAALAGSGALSGDTTVRQVPFGSATLAGASSLTVDGQARMVASAAMAGASSVFAMWTTDSPFSIHFSIDFAGGARGIVNTSASTAGAGAVNATAAMINRAAATPLAGSGSIVGFASVIKAASAAAAGSGAVSANATVLTTIGAAPFSREFSKEFPGGVAGGSQRGSATVAGAGAITAPVATARLAAQAAAVGSGTAAASASARRTGGTVAMAGASTMAGDATTFVQGNPNSPWSIQFSLEFTGNPNNQFAGNAALAGAGGIVGTTIARVAAVAALSGTGFIAANASVRRVASALLSGAGAVAPAQATIPSSAVPGSPFSSEFNDRFGAGAAPIWDGTASLAGAGSATAQAVQRMAARAILAGGSGFAANTSVRRATGASLAGSGFWSGNATASAGGSPFSIDFSDRFGR